MTSTLISIFESSVPFETISDSRINLLNECLQWFFDWEEETKTAPGTAAERKKMTLSDKTLFDIKSMVIGFKQMCIETFKKHPTTLVYPWRINTNLVENIFCQQRGLHGQNDHPRYADYCNGMNSVLLGCRTTTKKSNTGKIEELPFYKPAKLKR